MSAPASEPLSIRPATEDDLARLAEIELRVHVAPWDEAAFRSELSKPYSAIWMLTDDETDTQILGYVVFWSLFDEVQILNVAVDLPYRGLGHAKRMIRQVATQAVKKDLKSITLDVRKSNLSAIQLYQGLGFSITAVRKNFYSNGEDGYQMTLPLQGEAVVF